MAAAMTESGQTAVAARGGGGGHDNTDKRATRTTTCKTAIAVATTARKMTGDGDDDDDGGWTARMAGTALGTRPQRQGRCAWLLGWCPHKGWHPPATRSCDERSS